MAISAEAVTWAYRLFLDREPESAEVVEAFRSLADHAALRETMLGSAEYGGGQDSARIGRYLDRAEIDVEVDCSPEDLRAMLARIAIEWRRYGEAEPHWSVLVSEPFRQANIAAHLDLFYATGHGDVPDLLNPLARAGLKTDRLGTVLDFGCGVGRLSLALAGRADRVIGVDISPGHLKLARERAAASGIANAEFVAIDMIDDLDRFSGIDLVTSLIVLQHNPPPVMAELLRKLLRMLAPGGVAVIQLPTFIDGPPFRVADYLTSEQPSMEMNALPQRHVFEIADRAGCRVLEVREDGRIGDFPGISQIFAFWRP